jgi:hypothetical protein
MDGQGYANLIPADARERTARAFKATVRPAVTPARVTAGLSARQHAELTGIVPDHPSRKEPARDGWHVHMDAGGQDSGHHHQDLAGRLSELEAHVNAQREQ